jgi:hypothetical protein
MVLSPPITWIEALVALLEVGLSALLLGLFFTGTFPVSIAYPIKLRRGVL